MSAVTQHTGFVFCFTQIFCSCNPWTQLRTMRVSSWDESSSCFLKVPRPAATCTYINTVHRSCVHVRVLACKHVCVCTRARPTRRTQAKVDRSIDQHSPEVNF